MAQASSYLWKARALASWKQRGQRSSQTSRQAPSWGSSATAPHCSVDFCLEFSLTGAAVLSSSYLLVPVIDPYAGPLYSTF